ncbi:hypothetical protein [Mycolicibacterium celeriflavum]|uniref:Serine/threonine protein kinase n=2 Tax=Mycolicibacterium celeriflavum TaxID=1249101 RepID=A0A7I7RMZ9_MYCCF|nr:hypothetical protein [Mycolicibacterium celeriflavum]MCV7236910.1 hypothetical protein [Mycolicibacterium celeriflavum]BBY45521.1 hypothetical protein MCEL_38160 [Mycolicibacterium celeriflavum]
MSSSTPPEPGPQENDASVDGIHEPAPDDADTGPLQAQRPSTAAAPDFAGAQRNWSPRFDAPLTVNPRQVKPQRNYKPLIIGAAVVGAVAVLGGLVFWSTRPSQGGAQAPGAGEPTTSTPPEQSAASEDDARLLRQLPKGYRAEACETVPPAESVLAQVNCGRNDDVGGPLSATYSLVGDKAALEAVFNAAVAAATRVNCPGNIQSPVLCPTGVSKTVGGIASAMMRAMPVR